MANLFAIHSVGASLMTYLRNAYPEPLRTDHPCDFRMISSGEIEELDNIGTAVTLYLYRVTIDEHLRNLPANQRPNNPAFPLSLNLPWSTWSAMVSSICCWIIFRKRRAPRPGR